MTEVYTISSDSEVDEPKIDSKKFFQGNKQIPVVFPIPVESDIPNLMFEYVFGIKKIKPLTEIPSNVPSKQGKYLFVVKPSPEFEVETSRCDMLTPWGAPGIRPKVSNYIVKNHNGILKATTIRAHRIQENNDGCIGQMYYCRHALYNGLKKKIYYSLVGRKFNDKTFIVIVYTIEYDQNYNLPNKIPRNSFKLTRIVPETIPETYQQEENHFLDNDSEIITNQQILEQTVENFVNSEHLTTNDNEIFSIESSPKSTVDDYQKLMDDSKMVKIFENFPNQSYIAVDENNQIQRIQIFEDGKSVNCDCDDKISSVCAHLIKLNETYPNLKIFDASVSSVGNGKEIPVLTVNPSIKRHLEDDSIPESANKKMHFGDYSPSAYTEVPKTESVVRGLINKALKEYYVQNGRLEPYFNDYPFYLIKTTAEHKTKECIRCCRQISDDYVLTHFEACQYEQGSDIQLVCPTFSCFFIRYPYANVNCIISNIPEDITKEMISKILL